MIFMTYSDERAQAGVLRRAALRQIRILKDTLESGKKKGLSPQNRDFALREIAVQEEIAKKNLMPLARKLSR